VVKSTVTLRTGSVELAAGAAAGFGPDSSSGTSNTMSTPSIVAPTKRSLTRRSI
jgi:hypothetical protein